jgi:hypothetical protein
MSGNRVGYMNASIMADDAFHFGGGGGRGVALGCHVAADQDTTRCFANEGRMSERVDGR